MTKPEVPTIKRGGSRFYVDPVTGDKVPSVTSIVGCLPKRALQFWRGKMVAECAVEDFGVVADFVSKGNPSAAIDHLKRAPDRSSGVAAKTGSDVHNLCERIAKGEDVGRVHPDLQGFVDQCRRFIVDFEPGFLEVEATAWSETHAYAGTLDFIAMVGDEVVITDIKTGKSGAWPDVALQLSATLGAFPQGRQPRLPTGLPSLGRRQHRRCHLRQAGGRIRPHAELRGASCWRSPDRPV